MDKPKQKQQSLKQQSLWLIGRKKKMYSPLRKSLTADVVVVGGGLTGVLSAYLLSKEGKRVVLLEKNEIGSGATGYTTGFLTESIDTDYTDLTSAYGLAAAKAVITSHREAIHLVEKIVREHDIKCDFMRCSNYIYANSGVLLKDIEGENTEAKKLGIDAQVHQDGSALTFKNNGYMEIKEQALFHPVRFLDALTQIAVDQGVEVYEHTEVRDIRAEKEGVTVEVGECTITAGWAISATYEPFDEPLRLYFKKGMYISYVLQLHIDGEHLVEGMYEDTENPYHFFRVEKEKGGFRVLIGGEDHREDVHTDEVKSFNALKKYADDIFGTTYKVVRMWRGPVLEPLDGLPLIGALSEDHILYAAAFSGSGMTYAAIAAQLLTASVRGEKNILHEIYSPARVPGLKALMYKGRDYAQEFIGGALKNTFTQSATPTPKLQK